MDLKEALFTKTGPAVAKAVLGILFSNPVVSAATKSIFDMLLERWKDAQTASKGKIEFEKLALEVAERLLPIFEQNNLLENDRLAVAHAIADRLHNYPFSSKRLAELNNNPENLSKDLLSDFNKVTKDFSELATELYRRALKLSANYIVSIAEILPTFETTNFGEILERLTILHDNILQILDNIKHIHQTTTDEFEADYRQAVAREYDFMEIFGTDLDPASQRHQLTVAYINLNAIELKEIAEEHQSKTIPLRVEEAIAPHENILIIGPAGSGKTTIIKWLGVNIAQRSVNGDLSTWQEHVPFIIALRKLKVEEEFPMPEKWVALTTPTKVAGEPHRWTYDVLRSSKGLILIDGIDELPHNRRLAVRDWISKLKRDFPSNHFILTSRPSAIQILTDKKETQIWQDWLSAENFHVFELLDLQDEDLNHFIENWHKAVEKATPESRRQEINFKVYKDNLIKSFRNTLPLRRLAVTPLLCAMICAIHYCRKMNLPKDRIDLYEKCVEMLLERDPLKGVKLEEYPKFNPRQKMFLMSHIAYSMMRRCLWEFDYNDMRCLIANLLELFPEEIAQVDPDKTCEYFLARTGLLRQIIPGEIHFAHRTFEEYLAAYGVVHAGELNQLLKYIHNYEWHEVIILAAGLAGERGWEFIKNILSINEPVATILALACLETASIVPQDLQKEIKKKVTSLVPPMKKRIRLAISAAGDLAVKALSSYNRKWNANQAAACANTLGLIGTELALKSLFPYLFDKRVTVSRVAFKYLENSKLDKIANSILDFSIPSKLVDDNNIVSFISSALLYTNVNEEKFLKIVERIPQLFISLIDVIPFSQECNLNFLNTSLNSQLISVRRAAVSSFYKVGSDDNIPRLIALLNDQDFSVRRTALEALGKLHSRNNLFYVIDMLNDSNWKIRITAIKAFIKLGTKNELPYIIPMMQDNNFKIRIAALEAIGELGTQNDLPYIIPMLKDGNWRVRLAAVVTYGKLNSHSEFPFIKSLLKDREFRVRLATIDAMGMLEAQDNLPQIIPKLKSDNWKDRIVAVAVIRKSGTHNDLLHIIPMLKDRDLSVRREAVKALGDLGFYDDLSHIITMLKDNNLHVRLAAVEAFIKLGKHNDLRHIIPLLKDNNSCVRKVAVKVISKLGTHDDLPQIIPLLTDKDSYVRKSAVQVFGELGYHDDFTYIMPMLKDIDSYVLKAVVETMKKLVSKLKTNDLTKLLLNENKEVRHIAKVAIRKKFGNDIKFFEQLEKKHSTYPIDVKLYFQTLINNPEWLEELNRHLINAGEPPRW